MSQPSGPGVAVGAVHTEAAGLPLAPLLLRIEDGDGRPLLVGYTSSQRVRRVHRRDLDSDEDGCADDPDGVGPGRGRAAASLTSSGSRTPNVLETWTTYGSCRSSSPARKVGLSP